MTKYEPNIEFVRRFLGVRNDDNIEINIFKLIQKNLGFKKCDICISIPLFGCTEFCRCGIYYCNECKTPLDVCNECGIRVCRDCEYRCYVCGNSFCSMCSVYDEEYDEIVCFVCDV